jgi:hypothetical protein
MGPETSPTPEIRLCIVGEPDWPGEDPGDSDEDSDYDYISEPEYSTASTGRSTQSPPCGDNDSEEGAAPDRAGYVYITCLLAPHVQVAICSRPDISLSDQHYSMLRKRAAEFKKANAAARTKIIKECTDFIESDWPQDVDYDGDIVETVSILSAIVCHSHIFLSLFTDT